MADVKEEEKNKSSSTLKVKSGDSAASPQAGCSHFVFACFGMNGGSNDTAESANQRENGSPRDTRSKRVFPTLSGSSMDSSSSWDENILTSDEELLEDLELVLEGRGLVSTIFLPSKTASDPSSTPRTAFIRSKHGDVKIECQVVVDNEHVSIIIPFLHCHLLIIFTNPFTPISHHRCLMAHSNGSNLMYMMW